MNKIHLHTDIELLEGSFKDRFGLPIIVDKRLFGYFMQGSDIVKVVYNKKQAKMIIDDYKGEKLEPIYFYCA